jgi:hypothetical protein
VQKNDPAEFVDRLVAYAEQRGPRAEVRFRSYIGKSYEAADKSVRTSPYFAGNSSLPSRYFGSEHMRKREALAAPAFIGALQSLFPPEVIRFELGEPVPSPEPGDRPDPLPEASVPTLFIDHRTELSGTFTVQRPRGLFLGAGVFFETSFVIPGQKNPLEITVPTWRTPSRSVMQNKQRTTADVYEDLARRSFGMFLRRYFERIMRDAPSLSMPDIELPPDDSDTAR